MLLFIILLIIIYTLINNCSNEQFETKISKQFLTFDKMSKQIDILTDTMFKDTKVFNNDDNLYEDGNFTGLEKCFDKCDGTCVEFGVTGIAYCFK